MNLKLYLPLFICAVVSSAQGTYTVHDLGTLGGTTSQATAINNLGQVAGNSTTSSGQNHAFRTGPNQAITSGSDDLGTLGGQETYANDINASGQVVGRSQLSSGVFHAFRTGSNASITAGDDLGTFGGPSSVAHGINDAGQVTGSADTQAGIRPFERAFRTEPNHPIDSTTLNIGALAPTYQGTIVPSVGLGLNSAGAVTGLLEYDEVAPGYPTSFVFENGQIVRPGLSGFTIYSTINDSNQVVVSNEGTFGAYFVNGGLPQICQCATLGMNNAGQVVGATIRAGSIGVPPYGSAVLYDKGTLYNLNDLIPTGTGWTLLGALDINDHAQIVGVGTINGETHAFRLDPVTLPSNWLDAEMSLLTSFHLDQGTETSLMAMLRNVKASLERGTNAAAAQQLEAFRRRVESQSGRKLTADQSNQLLAGLNAMGGLL